MWVRGDGCSCRASGAEASGTQDLFDTGAILGVASCGLVVTDRRTVLRLGVPPTLARTLRSTNCIESMISICRNHSANVKNWQSGDMALRWCATCLVEAGKQFRRVNGHLHLPAFRAALQRHVAEQTVGADRHDETVNVA